MANKHLVLASAALLVALAAPAFAGGNNGGGAGGCGVGQSTNGCNGPVTNQPLSNTSLASGGAIAGGGSLTAAGTFSKGFVSTPNGLNSNTIQSVGLTEANAAAVGNGAISGNLGGPLTGSIAASGLTNSTSYSGSMVQGTGSAWNVTGGGAIAIGAGGALGATSSVSGAH